MGETLAITDRAYLLYEGTILQHGTPESLAADDDVRVKYLGSGFVLKRSVSVERAKKEHEEALAAAAKQPEAPAEPAAAPAEPAAAPAEPAAAPAEPETTQE